MPKDKNDLPYRPCVGVVLMNRDGRLFVGQRRDSEAPAWQMPQGGIDKGESPRAAALRELAEETGIPAGLVEVVDATPDWLTYDLPDHLIGKVWGGKYRGQKQKWFLMSYVGRDDQVRIDSEAPEFSAWRWLPPGEVLDQIVPFKRAVYGEVLGQFRKYFA